MKWSPLLLFARGFSTPKCIVSFHQNRSATLVELSERVGKYIDTEEFLKSKSPGFMDGELFKAKRKHIDKSRGKKLK